MLLTLIGIIVVGGAFGGWVRVALAPNSESSSAFRAIVAGVGAAVLVPLFLQTVSSDLLETILKSEDAAAVWRDLFVFAGFCVLAGITAQRFIDNLSDRVLRKLEKVEQKTDENSKKIEDVKQDVVTAETKADAADAKADAAHDAARFGTVDTGLEPAAPDSQSEAVRAPAAAITPGPRQDDPWKGAFGGAANNGRILEATVIPQSQDWEVATVTLRVRSTDSEKPLTGSVQFFLHPSFGQSRPTVPIVAGEARLSLLSYGAFTAGALADGGATKLELDLSELPDVRSPWKDR